MRKGRYEVNTVGIRDTAMLETDLARECILHGVGAIGRGRRPFARALLKGTEENLGASGTVSFYYTPLGMLVCVTLRDLNRERGVYTLTLSETDGEERNVRCAVPPLYARDGCAWCSALTGKLLPSEVSGRTVVIRELGAYAETVAVGRVQSGIA
jgi:hypothetical protein